MNVKPTMTLPDTVNPNEEISIEDIVAEIELDLTGDISSVASLIDPFEGHVDHFNLVANGETKNAVGSEGSPIPSTPHEDRKSTRLNSSHVAISYAVFCL